MSRLKFYKTDSLLVQEKVIGAGSFAVVYLGELRNDGTKVAVKKPRVDVAELKNVTAEIRRTVDLNHKNVIKFMGIMFDPELERGDTRWPWLITEFMENGTLTNFMKRFPRACTVAFKTRVTVHVASAMKYLSDNGIVHGDLHSSNCLISAHGKIVKVADFGLSFKITRNHYFMHNRVARFGRPQGDVISSRGSRWKPPEWVPGRNYRPIMMKASDVWCYGVLLFELWNDGLVLPYKRKSDGVASHLVARGFSPLEFNKCVHALPPARITNMMRRCFHFIPAYRPTFKSILIILFDAFPH